jgi:hypothetical protein
MTSICLKGRKVMNSKNVAAFLALTISRSLSMQINKCQKMNPYLNDFKENQF